MADFFLRVTRVRIVIVVLIVLAALFIDGYSLFYRYVVVHQPLPQKLTTVPNIGGHPITFVKGLDLVGGTELVVEVCHGFNDPPSVGCRNGPKGQSVSAARDQTIPLLEARVNGLGVTEGKVSAQGADQILIQLPGVGIDQAKAAVGTTAKLHFATAVSGVPNPGDPKFLADQENLYDVAQFNNTQLYPSGYHWKIDDALDASDVTSADVGTNSTGAIAVNISFNDAGATEWNKITTAAYAYTQQNPSAPPPQAQVAIFLDKDIITAPVVQQPSSNQTQITGGFTSAEAQALASDISAGALPAEIATVQTNVVSATLGQQTVQRSLIAGAVGLMIIVFFMIALLPVPRAARLPGAGRVRGDRAGAVQAHRRHHLARRARRIRVERGHGRRRQRAHLRANA